MKAKLTKSSQPRKPRRAVQSGTPRRRNGQSCPVVGVGASAGGLEAFTHLLKALPLDTGFGFVLVQHLDPQHESALTQLLAKATTMPVHEVTNNLRVEANHVYIIPPNTTLGIVDGVLKLERRVQTRIAPRSIDYFFETLARDQQDRAIGVILSGTATDGTLGLEAIKAEGGLTFAQDDSARYNSMPRSAVAAGCVDCVLAPADIARELARIGKHPYLARHAIASAARGRPSRPAAPKRSVRGGKVSARTAIHPSTADEPASTGQPNEDEKGYRDILRLLRNHCGVDFSLYKTTTIHRRITRRTVLSGCDSLASYGQFLRDNVRELDALYADALISVTSFFRNPEAFEVLAEQVFPKLLRERSSEPIRVWVLGCSTGQEAYSIAMSFAEAADKIPHRRALQIFATDLNEANLVKARQGRFAKSLAQDVSPERLRRFFKEDADSYRIIKPLRELVVFARHNVISDPPFSHMDLISCRNLMIYLEPSLQKKILSAFHYALKPEGYLFLGASESIGAFTNLFLPVEKKQKIFSRISAPTLASSLPISQEQAKESPPGRIARAVQAPRRWQGGSTEVHGLELTAEREADRVTVNQFAPPGVLVSADLQILQFRGATGVYLEAPSGKASFDLLKMARDGILLPLRAAIEHCRREGKTARQENVMVKHNGKAWPVTIEVIPLKNLKERCFLVLFKSPDNDAARTRAGKEDGEEAKAPRMRGKDESNRIAGLERELAETRDYLQSVQEHQEAANEELQASNEEGQSANEELQSLNEELETSKEELESTNEELTTVNDEMVSRNVELNRLNNDLTNLQSATNLAIVLLGKDLAIHRFSPQAEKQFNLLANDVGRPIGGIRHNLELPDLTAIVAKVIGSGRETEREVQDNSGHWYSLRVHPYVTPDHKVDGAVVVLVDIDGLKQTERLITEEHEHAEAIIRTVPNPLVILSADFRLVSTNEAFDRSFKVSPAAMKGRSLFEIGRGSWDDPQLRRMLKDIVSNGSVFDNFEVTHRFQKIGSRTLLLNARLLKRTGGDTKEILLGIHDITERKQAEEALREVRAQLAAHAVQLESVVATRTAELTASNKRLAASVNSIRRGKEEYRLLLAESQDMQKKLRQLTHQIITAQEEERKLISRELHDEVVQTLVGINVELSALGTGSSVGVHNLKEKIAHTQRLVENSVHAVHQFARELRPAVLDDLGLIPALHAYSKNLAARRKLKIQITAFGGVETLAGAERTVLFRVAQEALTNIARHAHASRVELTISKIPNAIQMKISDDGQSFSVEKTLGANKTKRLGLIGMKERVEMVGGNLTIRSAPGQGTTVCAEIPFYPEEPKL